MKNLTENALQLWGDLGRDWLAQLPLLVRQACERWGLYDVYPVKNLSYNYVLTGFKKPHQGPVVLKFVYGKQAFEQERDALIFYKNNGCVRLLDYNQEAQSLLLEQVQPGISLKTFCDYEDFENFNNKDDQAVFYAVSVMKKLHLIVLLEHDFTRFQNIRDWLTGLSDSKNSFISKKYLEKAQSLAHDLVVSSSAPVLLHGDLHHDNILSSSHDNWLAIDPKGVIGEPAYEVGAFIRNPMPELLKQEKLTNIISRRLDLFAQLLELDKQRLMAWSFVQAVLAACWMAEGNQDPKQMIDIIEIFNKNSQN